MDSLTSLYADALGISHDEARDELSDHDGSMWPDDHQYDAEMERIERRPSGTWIPDEARFSDIDR